ncbi:unnamed protein product [Urochloa humidicola]
MNTDAQPTIQASGSRETWHLEWGWHVDGDDERGHLERSPRCGHSSSPRDPAPEKKEDDGQGHRRPCLDLRATAAPALAWPPPPAAPGSARRRARLPDEPACAWPSAPARRRPRPLAAKTASTLGSARC